MATANLLAPVLLKRPPNRRELMKVQRRREWPTKVTQWAQLQVQNRVLAPSFKRQATPNPPIVLRLLDVLPWARRVPALFVGIGARPEHIRTPQSVAAPPAMAMAYAPAPAPQRNTALPWILAAAGWLIAAFLAGHLTH